MTEQLFPALIQLPFLGIFVFFALKMLGDFRADANERDAAWREFLDRERGQRLEAMQMGLEEVKHLANGMSEIAKGVTELAVGVASHDASASSRHEALIQYLNHLDTKT